MSGTSWTDDLALLSAHLGTDELAPLLDRSEPVALAAGDVLLRDQADTDSMYLVLSGRLEVHVVLGDHTIRLGEVEPGNWVGEVAYYTGCGKACSTVSALEPTRVLRLRFERYTELARSQTEVACRLGHVLISLLAQRLRATVNDPVLDPDGKLLMLGDMSIPLDRQSHHHGGLLDFFRHLTGAR